MQFRVLGPIEVTGESGPIPLGGPKQRAVLAHLIVRANQVVPAEALIDQVWGEEPPEAARNSLQSYVSHLRKALGADRLVGRAPGYLLHVAPDELDAARFEALLHEAKGADGDADRASAILREALGLWRGPAFADLAAEEALEGEIARLEELRLQALEERLAADLGTGRHDDAIGELESLTREHPLRERLWAGLMLALYRSGRQGDALTAFQRAREILAEELGVDPSRELRSLHERILRQDPDLEVKGEPLRGYRLLEQIGEGAFGVVYRAVQSQVGREVAVKSIHPDLANQPDFVRRFEREAQLVARIEHPHVVPLYDYWREPGGAYLVMRFLRGGTLEDLLAEGALPVERVADVLDQVASALAAAHRQSVVHRDVKPGNILLDEEGNAYLSDFGVALGAGALERTTGTMGRGTPAYLSPEQIRLEPITPRSDIYSIGVVLFEMLTGDHPFPEASLDALLELHLERSLPSARAMRQELPPAVDEVVARATAKDPGARFADALELAAAFRSAIAAPAVVVPEAGEIRNPYKGLRAFLEADAADFFGRETLVRRLVERLAESGARSRFLCVVGPSGSGKSSVVRAGLLPALRRGAVEGSDRWFVVDVMPGGRPLRELESALLGIAVEPPASLLEELARDELGLARAVDRVLPDPQAELLIVVDQLEEVFTLVDEAERAQLLESLRAAVEAPGSRVRVVATLRADLFDQPLSIRGFGELLAERTEAITPMSPDQIERAIAGPAERVGLKVEPGLVAAMVADVADRSGALPLLQYALTELAEQAGRTLTLDAYRGIGGVSGALARRAEALFQPLNQTARDACRQVFLRLVTLDEGLEDTRRRVRRSELLSLADARSMEGVIETFGRHRLLSFDRDPESREPTVEIAHEALLGEWGRLRDWVETSREDLRLHARLSRAAIEWAGAGRSPEDLLTGSRLDQAEEAVAEDSIRLTAVERQYLDASIAKREAEREAERTRHEREVRLERRSVRRLRALVAVLAVASLVAASLAVIAVDRSREAELATERERIGGLVAASVASLEADPQLSILLALHAIAARIELGEPVPAATVETLHWALQEAGVEYPRDGPVAVVSGPFGRRGVYDIPFPELLELARTHVGRELTVAECASYFEGACPALPTSFPAEIAAEPIRAIEPAEAGPPLAGTEVTVYTVFDEAGPYPADFRSELEAFTATTGIRVRSINAPGDFETWIRERVAAGDAPDLTFFPQPGTIHEFAQQGELVDIGVFLDTQRLTMDQSPYLVSLGTVGSDGSWPSAEGGLYGAFVDLNLKSLVWYPPVDLRAAGYDVPETWAELLALGDRLVADSRTPWCVSFDTGAVSGWPGTDWIENLVLAGAGPEVYDRWTFHHIPFASPPIRDAFERLGRILFTEDYVYRGVEAVPEIDYFDALTPMLDFDPPACWLNQSPGFVAKLFPEAVGSELNAFAFPAIGETSDSPVLGGGDMLGAFVDRPEVREVVRFLLSPEYGAAWAQRGHGFISSNRRFDLGNYAPFDRRQAEILQAALARNTFRFDASDLMPSAIGQGLFWSAMMTYLEEGPESLDRILAELDEAWPDG